jgi:hypothetical protein
MLPASWVDRIFDRMQGYYGSLWVDRWRSGDIDDNGRDRGLLNAKATWAIELGGFVGETERIAQAIESCRHRSLPPTLPEFLELCRQAHGTPRAALPAPKVDPEVAKQRAKEIAGIADGMAKRPGYDFRAWAQRIVANPKAYPGISLKFAKEALGAKEEA